MNKGCEEKRVYVCVCVELINRDSIGPIGSPGKKKKRGMASRQQQQHGDY